MVSTPADRKAEVIDRVVTQLRERLPEDRASHAVVFGQRYFTHAAPEDILEEDPDDLYGAILAHWNFASQRRTGMPLIRVYNPSFEEHGWQSTHTAVEIVTDDMPFLIDSVTMEVNRHGLAVHRLVHPVLRVVRDGRGQVKEVLPRDETEKGKAEAFMHLEVDRQTGTEVLEGLEKDLGRVLGDVRAAVEDWQPMCERMNAVIDGIDPARLPMPAEQVAEVEEFLRWVANDHFTFLGFREYELAEEDGEPVLRTVADSALGIMRKEDAPRISRSFAELPAEQRKLAFAPTLLTISKASARSTVHRPAHLDFLGIKHFDDQGRVTGESRFLGLYTSAAYSMNPRDIPLLRGKVNRVLERSGLNLRGHAGKALQNILDTFPRDDLIQATEDELYEISLGILHLQERQRLRLFLRHDLFRRFVSCIVYVPREHYNTALRLRMQEILLKAFAGVSCTFTTQFTESVLARVLFHIRTTPGQIPDYSVPEIEERLREAMLSWTDHLQRSLLEQTGEERGNELWHRYEEAFPAAYREDFLPRVAVHDILRLESLGDDHPLDMHLYRPPEDPEGLLRFKIFGREQSMPLSDVLPMLEKLGLRVLAARPYDVAPRDYEALWILDFDLREAHGLRVDASKVKEVFQTAFAQVWYGKMESDGFNRLVLGSGLAWRDVVMLRAYCKYLLQARAPFSQAYMERTLTEHPFITRLLVDLFHARFDPAGQDHAGTRTNKLRVSIDEALDKVSNLDEDRILRRFLAVMLATLRTNFFQRLDDTEHKEYLSFKFDPAAIPDLPLPRPKFEIFVYSPRTEGVHLRGGPVARGGLRWSDRQEDFRTEILGLVKAQIVKNSVIVPVGSKGGFIVKRPPLEGGREALQEEVLHCYKSFIRGLLDLTDNLVQGEVAPPPRVVRYDEDDPYLVVAADKGTATFSDVANSVSAEYGFWLGDAFASGGANGYDHKKMGITARGAWESVKRHFREMGHDTQNEDFTVIGIGDMAGDVFGNGMLLSRHIKLVGAFNHMHIFLDPDPDPESSYQERERLFKLPRSSWEDYDAELISRGGGIFKRSLKSITLSPEVRALLDVTAETLTPTELMQAMLKAPVDLLWNGGIGTYVKATGETNDEVGDRANDNLRINGAQLRCRVVGEGGNLGLTQRGRIEFAARDGHVLTDAIDNSGGVNCSDHEVNIKILLDRAVSEGDMTGKQRNALLAEMTEEVAGLVLRQNYLQPQAISLTSRRAAQLLGDQMRMIRALEKAGKLNRELEYLPGDEEVAERDSAGRGLTPPELAVLLAYGKITLFEELVTSDVAEDPYLSNELVAYFPRPLQERYRERMDAHPLRREIICTYINNSMLNRMGSTFAFRLRDETGEGYPEIARAYSAAREIFEGRRLWSEIEALDNQVPATLQLDMLWATQALIERATLWLLRNRRSPLPIEATITQFGPGIKALAGDLSELLTGTGRERLETERDRLTEAGVPESLAREIASLDALYAGLDVAEVAGQSGIEVGPVAAVYFPLFTRLELDWLRGAIAALTPTNHWQNRARTALMNGLYDQQRVLTGDVIRLSPGEDVSPERRLEAWLEHNGKEVERCLNTFGDLRSAGTPDLAMLSVALGEAANLSQPN